MKATRKQLAHEIDCKCGAGVTQVSQVSMTHRELKAIKAKKRKKDCYSLYSKVNECFCCNDEEDLIF